MAASQTNLSAAVLLVVVLLPVVAMAARELPSAGTSDCHPQDHLSGKFEGLCWGPFNDGACQRVCLAESSDNTDGFCDNFKCWCETTSCTLEAAVAAASAPIQH